MKSLLKKSLAPIQSEIVNLLGDGVPSKTLSFKWEFEAKRACTTIEDDPRKEFRFFLTYKGVVFVFRPLLNHLDYPRDACRRIPKC